MFFYSVDYTPFFFKWNFLFFGVFRYRNGFHFFDSLGKRVYLRRFFGKNNSVGRKDDYVVYGRRSYSFTLEYLCQRDDVALVVYYWVIEIGFLVRAVLQA